MKRLNLLLVGVGILFLSAACSGNNKGIEIQDAWIRAASRQPTMEAQPMDQTGESGSEQMENMAGSNSAAYLIIKNNSSQPDRLLNARSEFARSTELHVSQENNGVMTMRPVDGVDVPAGGTVELKPGSYHIMLVDISQNLTPGEVLKLSLEFENAGEIEVQAEVRAP